MIKPIRYHPQIFFCKTTDGQIINMKLPIESMLLVNQLTHQNCKAPNSKFVRVYMQNYKKKYHNNKQKFNWVSERMAPSTVGLVCTNCNYEITDEDVYIASRILLMYMDIRATV